LSIAPIPHGEGLPIAIIAYIPVVSLSEGESVSLNAGGNEDFFQANASKEPHL
jgi:hypothetical protein